MKNNEQKYTEDESVAEDWAKHIEEGQKIMSYEYEGKKYFCIKRLSDDYVVKPYTFKSVNLEDI